MNLFIEFVIERLKNAAIKKIIAAFPFFNLPFINPILSFFVNKIFKAVKEELEVIIISVEVESKKKAYVEATEKLKEQLKNYQLDDEKTKKLSDEFDRTLLDLVVISDRV